MNMMDYFMAIQIEGEDDWQATGMLKPAQKTGSHRNSYFFCQIFPI